MILLMYNEEQDALRLFDTDGFWVDMFDLYHRDGRRTDLQMLLDCGWELVGDFTYY